MAGLKFVDMKTKQPLRDVFIYIWDPNSMPHSSEFPDKAGQKPIACGLLNKKGLLVSTRGLGASCPTTMKVAQEAQRVRLLRSFDLLSGDEGTSPTIEDTEEITIKSVTELPPQPRPVLNFRFFALSHATFGSQGSTGFADQLLTMAKALWNPREEALQKYGTIFLWDKVIQPIQDPQREFRRIDFRISGSPKAIKLVTANVSNIHFDPVIPVFLCVAAWDEINEPGEPRDGLLQGYTLSKLSGRWWPGGERAILIFETANPKTLAHELVHWFGSRHSSDPTNLGSEGAQGIHLERDQFRTMYRWAISRGHRRTLATR